MERSATLVLGIALALGVAGCQWLPWARTRPDPAESVSGPPVVREDCEVCHVAPVAEAYQQSLHHAMGIHCGQCHIPGGHPDFAQPIRDGKCGGCHQDQYQQTLASPHFSGRVKLPLDSDREKRKELRANGHRVAGPDGMRFAGDAASGALGGRLCVSCHYDEHRLGRGAVQEANFCMGCHTDKGTHYAFDLPGPPNRCINCHVRVGQTINGQPTNTHVFRMSSGEEGQKP